MNKIFTIALIAGGLLLLESPEAAAHKEVRNQHNPQAHYYSDSRGRKSHRHNHRRDKYNRYNDRRDYYAYGYRGSKYKRARHMPRWLQRERAFIRWYDHSELRRNRYIAWHILFDIYRAEHRYHRRHRY